MEKQTYNGWTNYATWRINLEIFDNVAFLENHTDDVYEYSKRLKEYTEEVLQENSDGESLVYSYAMSFIEDVNWIEIAESMIAQYESEES